MRAVKGLGARPRPWGRWALLALCGAVWGTGVPRLRALAREDARRAAEAREAPFRYYREHYGGRLRYGQPLPRGLRALVRRLVEPGSGQAKRSQWVLVLLARPVDSDSTLWRLSESTEIADAVDGGILRVVPILIGRPEAARAFAATHDFLEYQIVPASAVDAREYPESLPVACLVDPAGIVQFVDVGYRTCGAVYSGLARYVRERIARGRWPTGYAELHPQVHIGERLPRLLGRTPSGRLVDSDRTVVPAVWMFAHSVRLTPEVEGRMESAIRRLVAPGRALYLVSGSIGDQPRSLLLRRATMLTDAYRSVTRQLGVVGPVILLVGADSRVLRVDELSNGLRPSRLSRTDAGRAGMQSVLPRQPQGRAER